MNQILQYPDRLVFPRFWILQDFLEKCLGAEIQPYGYLFAFRINGRRGRGRNILLDFHDKVQDTTNCVLICAVRERHSKFVIRIDDTYPGLLRDLYIYATNQTLVNFLLAGQKAVRNAPIGRFFQHPLFARVQVLRIINSFVK
jgi:hypothetical protein